MARIVNVAALDSQAVRQLSAQCPYLPMGLAFLVQSSQQNGQGGNWRPKLHRNQVAWTMLVQCKYAKPVHLASLISEGQIEESFTHRKFPASHAHPAPQFTSGLHVYIFCCICISLSLSLSLSPVPYMNQPICIGASYWPLVISAKTAEN